MISAVTKLLSVWLLVSSALLHGYEWVDHDFDSAAFPHTQLERSYAELHSAPPAPSLFEQVAHVTRDADTSSPPYHLTLAASVIPLSLLNDVARSERVMWRAYIRAYQSFSPDTDHFQTPLLYRAEDPPLAFS